MKPLDPVEVRLFPRLARFARRQWWLGALGIVAVLCTLSFAGGVVVGHYQGMVALENYHAVVRHINDLEQEYEKHHPKSTRTTKAQAVALMEQVEKRRKEQRP
jgi:ammonia channel protein AmtB